MKDPVFDENSELGKKSRWYIVHTYSGFEQRVQKTINEMIRTGQCGQFQPALVDALAHGLEHHTHDPESD